MEFYNKHYILVDDSYIVDGWSDGPWSERDTTGAICINETGGYQFRLYPDGEENPALMNENGAYLYKYVDGAPIECTAEEIAAQEAELNKPVYPIAPRNIAIDEYITVNGTLYKATSNIPNGETIIVGQNAIETTVEKQLYELTKGE